MWKDDRRGVMHPIPHLQGPCFGGQGSGITQSQLTANRSLVPVRCLTPHRAACWTRLLLLGACTGRPPPAASVLGAAVRPGDRVAVWASLMEPMSWWAGRLQSPRGKRRALGMEQSDAARQASPTSPRPLPRPASQEPRWRWFKRGRLLARPQGVTRV